MATETLKRVKVSRPPKVTEETKQIAREAKLILGYNYLSDQVIEGIEPLPAVLRRLDIKPFSWQSVRAYQEKKRNEHNEKPRAKYVYNWNRKSLRDASDVPLFILRKAIEIKLAAPKAQFFIEELSGDPDPFLIAKMGDDEFYIDVWDEKDFEAKL